MPRGRNDYERAKQGSRLWTPAAQLPDLFGWYEAADISTITTTSGTSVTPWAGKSGTRNLSQASAGFRPDYTVGGFAGCRTPAVKFTVGSVHHIHFASSLSYNSSIGYSCVAVVEHTGNAGTTRSICGGNSGAACFGWNGNTLWLVRQGQALSAQSGTISSGVRLVGFDAISGSCAVYVDGSTGGTGGDPAYSQAIDGVGIGNVNGEYFDGCIPLMIFAKKLATYPRQRLEGYAAWACNVQGNLPGGHPFKNRPPLIGD